MTFFLEPPCAEAANSTDFAISLHPTYAMCVGNNAQVRFQHVRNLDLVVSHELDRTVWSVHSFMHSLAVQQGLSLTSVSLCAGPLGLNALSCSPGATAY